MHISTQLDMVNMQGKEYLLHRHLHTQPLCSFQVLAGAASLLLPIACAFTGGTLPQEPNSAFFRIGKGTGKQEKHVTTVQSRQFNPDSFKLFQ